MAGAHTPTMSKQIIAPDVVPVKQVHTAVPGSRKKLSQNNQHQRLMSAFAPNSDSTKGMLSNQ